MDFSTQNPQAIGANKKLKRNLRETDSEDEVDSPFPRFISIELKSSPITSLSPFIIEKVISSNITPKSVKKIKKWYITRWGGKKKTCGLSVENDNVQQYCSQNVPSQIPEHK